MDFFMLLLTSFEKQSLIKAVFSKPADKTTLRTVVTPRTVGGRTVLQAETFRTDGKAIHENVPPEDVPRLRALIAAHGQANLFTSAGDCELRTSKSGKTTLLGGEKLARALAGGDPPKVAVSANDRKKARILSGDEPFLRFHSLVPFSPNPGNYIFSVGSFFFFYQWQMHFPASFSK